MQKRVFNYCLVLVFAILGGNLYGQFVPVPLSGFNHDVIAESGNSSLTNTTSALDGVNVSNKVMYTTSFAATNAFGGGGVPDNGLIVDGAGSYQLAAYNSNNALIVPRNSNADINLVAPASYSVIRVLCFSTEGSSLVNIKLYFTDGSFTNALSGYSLGDWFNNTSNVVLSGFGRCTRSTPASGVDAYPNNPRLYYIEIPVSCADRQKLIQKINFSNVTTQGTNAPYPNAVFFALSAKTYSQNVTASVTDATCNASGSVTLSINGSSPSYTVTWNSTPAQSGLTATNLNQGNYTATIVDAANCTSTFPVTIGLNNNLTMNNPSGASICAGESYTPDVVSNAAAYSWTPTAGVSNASIANPVLSPTVNTDYTVTGTLGGCTVTRSVIVNVTTVNIDVRTDTTICFGASFVPTIISNATSYSWSPATGVSNTSIVNPVLSPAVTTAYTITGHIGACSTSRSLNVVVTNISISSRQDTTICFGDSFLANLTSNASVFSWSPTTGVSNSAVLNPILSPASNINYTVTATEGNCSVTRNVRVFVRPQVQVDAGNNVDVYAGLTVQLNGSGSAGTYVWTPATGLSSTTVLNPYATPDATTVYTLTITTAAGCSNSDNVTVTVIPYCLKPMHAFSPNGDGINDKWLVTDGNCVKKLEVAVYNRYGSKVYESKDYHNDWDGKYNGKPLPDATYYYVIHAVLLNDKQQFLKGDVTIIR